MKCECGCGGLTALAPQNNRGRGLVKGEPQRFIAGHQWRSGMQRKPPAERFWSKVAIRGPGDCWEWTRCRHKAGYGRFQDGSGVVYAHRFAYEATHGPIPAGLQICHTCDNPPCCNPAHMFLGTAKDNALDKAAKGRTVNPLTIALAARTHCPKGHPYDEANTLHRIRPDGGKGRACRACLREWSRRYAARKRGLARAAV